MSRLSLEEARNILAEYPDADLSAFDIEGDPDVDALATAVVAASIRTIRAFQAAAGGARAEPTAVQPSPAETIEGDPDVDALAAAVVAASIRTIRAFQAAAGGARAEPTAVQPSPAETKEPSHDRPPADDAE